MKYIFIILNFIILMNADAATWKKIKGATIVLACPAGYIYVQPLAPYTTRNFCVMKYEAKKDAAGMPESVPEGIPWVSITRVNAQNYCRALGHGYEVISTNEWQTIARNIAATSSNWSSGIVGSGQINQGHADSSPANPLAASSDDNNSCFETEQTCSSIVWNTQRRTHILSSGDMIWDFSGNVNEWTNTDITTSPGSSVYFALVNDDGYIQRTFGADTSTLCSSPATNNNCGMGYGFLTPAGGAISRGGAFTTITSGIFGTNLTVGTSVPQTNTGFRCTYTP